MNNLCHFLMPLDIPPHAHMLWAAKVTGGDGGPTPGIGGFFGSKFAEVLDPIPRKSRPIFIINNPPALGGYERSICSLRMQRRFADGLSQQALPIVWAASVDPLGIRRNAVVFCNVV